MQKIGFIRPDGKVEMLTYPKMFSYCKDLCEKEEYKERFEEFKKDYTYFPPYFDFVTFELKYIFVNPLFQTGQYVSCVDGALFKNKLSSFDYQENISSLLNRLEDVDDFSFFTKCSDTELNIQKEEVDQGRDVLIDCNLMGMMSHSGTVGGSHSVTANTVLNQLMMLSPEITQQYSYFLENDSIDFDNDALRFLMEYLGFMRATDYTKMLLGNEKIYSKEQQEFVQKRIEHGFQVYDCGDNDCSFIPQYQEKISKH